MSRYNISNIRKSYNNISNSSKVKTIQLGILLSPHMALILVMVFV